MRGASAFTLQFDQVANPAWSTLAASVVRGSLDNFSETLELSFVAESWAPGDDTADLTSAR
ncbi:hypothetical protein C9I28_18310 [Pseudoduganella armeniaca]|uniref:Uncharacterized protein n=1 Tax=Pseudoduganella armeniaca TaxID=2072590 RepID=A0A2R4CCN2_9BURK|nr:hypothetical protein C9I28_18310 [Pseudoduganella armeniaca]